MMTNDKLFQIFAHWVRLSYEGALQDSKKLHDNAYGIGLADGYFEAMHDVWEKLQAVMGQETE